MRSALRSIMLLAGLVSACAATPALAQTKDQQHVATELARLNPVSAALSRFCKTSKPAAYICGAPKDSLARAIAAESAYAAPYVPPAPVPAPSPLVATVIIHGTGATLATGQTMQLATELHAAD